MSPRAGPRADVTPLAARQVPRAVVYPTIRLPSHPGKLLMGVFDAHAHYVEGTVLDRRSGEIGGLIPLGLLGDPQDAAAPEAIYAGPLYFHFGHFLLESLARAWYARRHPELPLVWAGSHTWQGFELRSWQREILDVLGLTNPTVIAADPTRFELLHVPDIGYRYDDWCHPEHAEFLASHAGPAQVAGARLWLSRSQLDSDARDLNAQATERRLEDAGWTVIHPQTLSVRDQLAHLGRAEVVAGEEGSAFHLVALLKDLSSKRLEVFRRYGEEHRNMTTIGDARGIDQTFHTLETERLVRAKGRVVTKITPNSSEILDVLDEPVLVSAGDRAAADDVMSRAVETLAPDRFLDVASADPALLLTSEAATRVAVSPRFAVDPRTHAGSGIDFFEIDLDQYVRYFRTRGKPFDVIRIAEGGLDEVMASFQVSKRLAHDGTTWLLGSGDAAARAAVAVRLLHPGYAARRVLVRRTAVYVARRVPGEPRKEGAVAALSEAEITKRARRLPVTRLRRVRRPGRD